MLTSRQAEILEMVRRDPMLAQQDIARRLGISRSAVAGHIMALTDRGFIRGRGYVLSDSEYVCVIGGANVDIEGRVDDALALADSNLGTVARSPGGVGRNIAENLARLDMPTRLISVLGRDPDGTWLHDETASSGVDLVDSIWIDDAPTATYLSVVDEDGEMVVAVNDMAAMEALDPTALDARTDAISNAAAVVVDCNLSAESLEHLLRDVVVSPVFVDPVSSSKAPRIAPHLASVHTLKPNRAEAALLSGVEISGVRSLRSAARALIDAGVQQVVISLGGDGVFFADTEVSGTLAQHSVGEITSVTGAGDALMAGLVHAHISGLPLEEATRFALAAAAITATSEFHVSERLTVDSIHEMLDRVAS